MDANSSGIAAVALGSAASASANSAIAIGDAAKASQQGSMALGATAIAQAANAVALGAGAVVSGINSVALGANTVADRANTVSVGSTTAQRQIVNVAAGTQNTDAVNVAQLKAAGLTTDTSGNVTNAFVAYDDSTKAKISLGGGVAGTTITNVKAGALGASSTDAVNGSQLFATNTNVTNLTSTVNSMATGNAVINSAYIKTNGANDGTDNAANNVSDGVVIGANAKADTAGAGVGVIAIGSGAHAGSYGLTGATALGAGSSGLYNGTAIGYGAKSTARQTVAVGMNSAASQSESTALGFNASASAIGSSAFGKDSSATADLAVALGKGSVADRVSTVSVGTETAQRQIVNVAAGTADTDAVNLKQLKTVGLNVDTSGNVTNAFVAYDDSTKAKISLGGGVAGTTITNVNAGAIGASSTDAVNGSQLFATNTNVTNLSNTVNSISNGSGIKYFHVNSTGADSVVTGEAIAIGPGGTATGGGSIAIGRGASALMTTSYASTLAVGDGASAKGRSVALGASASASDLSMAVGLGATASNGNAVAVGNSTQAASGSAIALGTSAAVDTTSTYAMALGANASITGGINSIALGASASVTQASSVALGSNTSVTAGNAVALGTNSVANRANTVSVGTGTAQRQIVNVAAGTADTDAVNVKQLKSAGLTTDTSGNVTNAFVAYDDSTKAKISLGGGVAGTTLTNVKAGALGASSTDAVNGSQLFVTNANVTTAQTTADAAKTAAGTAQTSADAAAASAANAVQFNASLSGNADVKSKKLVNVAAGTADTDAVNLKQLKAVGLNVDTSGNVTNAFVAYDDSTKAKISLGGGAAGTTLMNVKAGALGASSTDAVNGSQLFATNANVTTAQTTADAAKTAAGTAQTSADAAAASAANAVQFNASLGGNADVKSKKLVNVAAGTADTDAVNVKQLKNAGLTTDTSGNVTNAFVAYDDSTKAKISLGGGVAATTITNVKAAGIGASSTDAVNGSQLYGTASSVATALGGNASVNADGTVHAPSYVVQGGTFSDVGSALSKLDTATAMNTGDITTLNTTVNNISSGTVGLVQQDATTKAIAVAGTTAGTTVDFTGTAGARQLKGVAAGTQNTDAVNVAQLKAAGLSTDTSGNVTNAFVAYDDSTKDKVTLGGAAGTTLTNLKAGALSASSTDAVVGSQLYTTNQNITQNTAAIAQNTTDIAKNAGDITNIDSRVSTVEGSVTNITNQINSGELGLVQQDQTSRNLTVAAATDGTQISVAGTAGNRAVTGVAAGSLTASSNDAVNGSQLYATNQNVAQNAAAIAQNTSDIAENASAITTLNTTVNNINSGSVGLVQQDATSHKITVANATAGTTVDFAGTTGARQLKGVATGIADTDAVNVAQLKAAGLSTDASGNVTNAFVAYDDNTKDALTLGGGVVGTSITNLKAGVLSASSTDAVNGSQLYTTNQNVAQNTAAITQNESDIAQNTSDIAKNAGDITSIDSRVTNVEGSMTNITNQINSGELGLVQQDQTSRDLTVAKNTDGTHVDFAGTAGARELLGVAAGTTLGSAVNLGQLSPVVAALGGGAQVNADGSIISPTYHMQGGTQTTVGGALDALNTNLSSLTSQINTGSIGMVTQDSTSRDLRVGASTDGLRISMAGTAGNRVVTGVAAGAVNASSSDVMNGSQLYANAGSTASALGGGSVVNADGTISAPTYSVGGTTVNNVGAAISNIDGRVSQNTSDIANLQTTVGTMSGSVANAVQYDSAAHDKVTLGGVDSASKVALTNLQDGEVSATSTDAVTGAQLWNTNQQISDLNQTVQNYQTTGAAGMSIDNGGAPAAAATGSGSMAMGGGSQASGDNSMAMGSGANASGSGSMAMGAGAQASADNSVALGAGSVADQANTVSVGSPGNERRITNVADGKAPTDAVNMRQFQSGMGAVARNAYSGVAAATALTMIPEVDPAKTLAVGVAGGSYKGYQAAAIGASARITANLKVKVGAGISAADTTYGVGASYQW
ncbi:YadA-like family protein [Paraburkholderia agricolaris]|uniref:YadA-like family protein n=1 Tax=Paraburkholderia agricolaris TaxID=2152888 RepID=UPI0038BDDCDB